MIVNNIEMVLLLVIMTCVKDRVKVGEDLVILIMVIVIVTGLTVIITFTIIVILEKVGVQIKELGVVKMKD